METAGQPIQQALSRLATAGFDTYLELWGRGGEPSGRGWLLRWKRKGVAWYTTARSLDEMASLLTLWSRARESSTEDERRWATPGEPPRASRR